MSDTRLSSLITETPQEGDDLAVKMARVAVKMTEPDADVRDNLRAVYADDADALIAVSAVVATHFQTVAAANTCWRSRTGGNFLSGGRFSAAARADGAKV